MVRNIRNRCLWLILSGTLGWLLAGCATIQAEAALMTRLNALGGGEHNLVLAVPSALYSGGIFDQLPDFSLITGVNVQDYQSADRRGLEVRQSFFRLGQLNADGGTSHFLNKAFPGAPLEFEARWGPGLFVHPLQIRIFVNSSQSNAIAQGISAGALGLLNANYTLQMPGDIIHHNGSLLGSRTVVWEFDPTSPQVLEVTAQVISIPFLLSAIFSLGAILLFGSAYYTGRSAATRPPGFPTKYKNPARPSHQSPTRQSRPTTRSGRPPQPKGRDTTPRLNRR